MNQIRKRLARLEEAQKSLQRTGQTYRVIGPAGEKGRARAFLAAQGIELTADDLVIYRGIVSMPGQSAYVGMSIRS